mgnify:CR=1 FL=1|jgi:hypothetical protein
MTASPSLILSCPTTKPRGMTHLDGLNKKTLGGNQRLATTAPIAQVVSPGAAGSYLWTSASPHSRCAPKEDLMGKVLKTVVLHAIGQQSQDQLSISCNLEINKTPEFQGWARPRMTIAYHACTECYGPLLATESNAPKLLNNVHRHKPPRHQLMQRDIIQVQIQCPKPRKHTTLSHSRTTDQLVPQTTVCL